MKDRDDKKVPKENIDDFDEDLEEYDEEAEEELESELEEGPEDNEDDVIESSESHATSQADNDYEEYHDYEDDEEDEDEYVDYDGDYDDDDDDDDDDDGNSKKTKIIIISAVAIAALIAIGGFFTYKKLTAENKANREQTIESQIEEETQEEMVEQEATESTETETSDEEDAEAVEEDAENSEDVIVEDTPIPTSTPKPLPTATPTPIESEHVEQEETEPGPAEIGTQEYYESLEEEQGSLTADQNKTYKVLFVGDSRFRKMANVVPSNEYGWVCSMDGDYNWLTDTVYSNIDGAIGKDTKIFINIGLNDLSSSVAYATSLNEKATEWQNKGAKVYFVSVGPVAADSSISNQDICNFNTYMYNNLSIPFIDAYNELVSKGFTTEDYEAYTAETSLALYNYICSFI